MPRQLYTKYSKKRSRPVYKKNKGLFSIRKKINKKKNPILKFSLFVFIITIAIFSFYLFLSIQLVEMNYSLGDREEELAMLENDIKGIESQISSSFSIKELNDYADNLKLTKAKDIRYLKTEVLTNVSLKKED